MTEIQQNQRKELGLALAALVEQARQVGPKVRVGLMMVGSELPRAEFLTAAQSAMAQDKQLVVVGIGPRHADSLPEGMDWIECQDSEADSAHAMEQALNQGAVAGVVALHYPFPLGVCTVGRAVTPARGKAMFMAACTGMAATNRAEAMVRNAVYGIAVAKSMGLAQPSLGLLNVDSAPTVERALRSLQEGGYPLCFGSSTRADGGALLRGNDVLAGAVDVCVCDTLTGNVLMKMLAAFTAGGSYESCGWGYGPSVGEHWDKVVSIVSRASGAPVIANALLFTVTAVRGKLPQMVAQELAAARAAGLDEVLARLAPRQGASKEGAAPVAPPAVPTDDEIHGVDVLDLEQAVHHVWQHGIYAEAAMGCTGPVVKIAAANRAQVEELLRAAQFIA